MEYWLIFAFLYPLLYSVINIIDKFLLEKKVKNCYSYSVLTGFLSLLSALVIFLIFGLQPMSATVMFIALLGGAVYGTVFLIYFHLLTYSEVSRVIGMGYLFVAFVAVYSWIFLGETLSVFKYFAIGLAILGTILLAVEKSKKRLRFTHIFWLMVLYAALLGIVDVCDKYVLEYISYWETYILITVAVGIVCILPILRSDVRRDLPRTLRVMPAVSLIVVLTVFASMSFLKAADLAPISIVSALGTLQPAFVFFIMLAFGLFAPKLLKEVITPGALIYKILGLGCIITGAIILCF